MIAQGDGQHVGTVDQVLNRLVTGFYFIGHRWPDVDRTLPTGLVSGTGGNAETKTINELGTECEITGSSGYQRLDDATCAMLMERAQFTPGRDERGHATRSTYDGKVVWKIS